MSTRKLSRQQRWRVEKVQAERNARASRRDENDRGKLEAGEYGPEQPGRVIAHFGRTLDIEANDGSVHRCHRRANLDSLVTGDRVSWREANDGTGVVVARGERDSTLERPDHRGQLKPVAANIDRILIVFAAEPVPHPNLIDRYLIAAETTEIQPALVLNKVDLLPPHGGELRELLARYQGLGYEVINATVREDGGLEELRQNLAERTSVFVGQSGVGKSSLINALLPDEELKVGALSEDTRKGTHTTTTAKLYHFPAGGDLIDSPGIREFGLMHLDERQVAEGFIEFRPHLGHCRFRDCRHVHEPGCAILKAVEQGEISATRFDSFRRIIASLST
ncbi:small ribosomal subunit biogenesis GTPase RsgA [Phytohalomonas tamaricis]|uniref:small ribosomal subunit biogenesis GTPase RsgA n=1 Tax=Phytohalomonas tamaricis TaxID=2081032 RepID=UPI000D0B228B|nr:small ribosomal subunit biogenesis GTPase RsgA [Phytohalomonas tamaricis]